MEMAETPRAGSLLVATARLGDPNFRRTVVYLIAHNQRGSIGIVVNRPSETAVHTVLPPWAPHAARPPVVYVGGPVQTDAAMALGVLRRGEDSAELPFLEQVAGPVVLVNLDTEPAVALPHLRGIRIYAGHAGWGDGQLDDEIAEGAWTVLAGGPEDLLAGPMIDVYFRVLRRQGWPAALDAYRPVDLARN
jgi:putative transcriptional regulator